MEKKKKEEKERKVGDRKKKDSDIRTFLSNLRNWALSWDTGEGGGRRGSPWWFKAGRSQGVEKGEL